MGSSGARELPRPPELAQMADAQPLHVNEERGARSAMLSWPPPRRGGQYRRWCVAWAALAAGKATTLILTMTSPFFSCGRSGRPCSAAIWRRSVGARPVPSGGRQRALKRSHRPIDLFLMPLVETADVRLSRVRLWDAYSRATVRAIRRSRYRSGCLRALSHRRGGRRPHAARDDSHVIDPLVSAGVAQIQAGSHQSAR